jgi:hypothetical protein
MMMAIALDVLRLLVLLVPAVVCLAWPEAIRERAVAASRRRGLRDAWHQALLGPELVWSIRLTGGVLLVLSGLLAFVILPRP